MQTRLPPNPSSLGHAHAAVGMAVWLVGWLVVGGWHGQALGPGDQVQAQPPLVWTNLSLAGAQSIAFERNWDLLAAKSDVDAALAQKIIAKEFPNPTLTLLPSKINVDNKPNSTVLGNEVWNRSYDTFAIINQLFEIGGKRRDRRLSAEAGVAAARARLLDAKRVLESAVATAYLNAALAQADVEVLQQSARTLRLEADIAATRLRAGDISVSDKNQIEIGAERFELQARTAAAGAVSARIALETLLGYPRPVGEVQLSDSLEALAGATVPASTPGAAAGRPDLVAAEQALKKAEADLRLQKAVRIPDPTVQLQYERNPPDSPNSIGLGVSLPLPLWNHNRGAIGAAQAARDQAQIAMRKIQGQIAADIANARVTYHEALARWSSYREVIRPKSAEIRKSVAYAYSKGGASLLDLLSAERNDNDVRLAAVQAASDSATAAAALKAALAVAPASALNP